MSDAVTKPGPSLPDQVAELWAAFPTKAAMHDAVAQLRLAGFDRADLTIHAADGDTSEGAVTDPVSPTDQRQLRTMGASMAGAVGAMAAAGVTVATGGAAAVVIGAALAGGVGAGAIASAASSPSDGVTGAGTPATRDGRFLLSVRTGSTQREETARAALLHSGGELTAPGALTGPS